MTNWNNIKKVDLQDLIDTRISLHRAIQLVGAVPRNLLPHDPTDASASLIWNLNTSSLESESIPGFDISVGLSFNDFQLNIFQGARTLKSTQLSDNSVDEALSWLKSELSNLGLDGNKINLNLPYEMPTYENGPLEVDKSALEVFDSLYSNIQAVLDEEVVNWKNAFDIRCWPHHFDLATLIPLELDANGEVLKSIGVGLSPGDEGIDEPYIYINIWPSIEYDKLAQHKLPAGHWNKEGWSGAVLTYSDFVSEDQEQMVSGFIREVVHLLHVES
ncbi:hypothetical protein [Ekhidna sp.]